MPPPTTGADLQQFVCAFNWMRTTIPSFSELLSPLHSLLELVYAKAGRRTKSAVSRIPLSEVVWDPSHLVVFKSCQTVLANATTLAHPSADKRICLYTDASQDFWSAIVTQVPPSDLEFPPAEQRHEPLAFLSGHFTGAMHRWPIIEKEAYAIIASCNRLDWLLQRSDGFSLFTDHHNLLYVFNPGGSHGSQSALSAAKLIRWALRLSSFSYTIEHVPGTDNVWSDMLTRWYSYWLRWLPISTRLLNGLLPQRFVPCKTRLLPPSLPKTTLTSTPSLMVYTARPRVRYGYQPLPKTYSYVCA
jgi:hypothetical protein